MSLPFSDLAAQIIEKEPVEELLTSLIAHLLAAASLGQVHTLKGNEYLAIKVQRHI
jgi:predicted unusual protein kinase regulating ubiquinone biosynthesis (AarF/ABC1/UbiB family)